MGYPETATGFMVNDQKNWTQFEKKEVCTVLSQIRTRMQLTSPLYSSLLSLSRTVTLTSPLTLAVFAAPMSTLSLVSRGSKQSKEHNTNIQTGGWGDAPMPLCVGHEVVGRAIKVGKDVKTVKVGDRVGVGAQIQADLTCVNCKADQENYCPNCKLQSHHFDLNRLTDVPL